MTLEQRIKAPGQKKILALDGGGIRGIISIEVIAAIEKMLREALQQPKLVLADWFDFFAGTSTGAIIASCLALGKSADDIRDFYHASGELMFDKAFVTKRWYHKFEQENLATKLKEVFGADTILGSENLRTLLMLVMRNATTDSPWPLSNNPFAKYNQTEREDCNLRLPLWQLVRASTAAPIFFPPEVISVGKRDFTFVDGGITTYNNPAFQSFIMATVQPYKLQWETGEDKMLLVSIGTGSCPETNFTLYPSEMNLVENAKSLPLALMYAALNEQDFLCRTFGNCLVGDELDREVGTMIEMKGPVDPKLFTYLRYNAELTREGLHRLGLTEIEADNVRPLDCTPHMKDLRRIGVAVAEKVNREHFARFLQKHD